MIHQIEENLENLLDKSERLAEERLKEVEVLVEEAERTNKL